MKFDFTNTAHTRVSAFKTNNLHSPLNTNTEGNSLENCTTPIHSVDNSLVLSQDNAKNLRYEHGLSSFTNT